MLYTAHDSTEVWHSHGSYFSKTQSSRNIYIDFPISNQHLISHNIRTVKIISEI